MSHDRTAPIDDERPETYPVYEAVRRVPLDDAGELVVVGVKNTGLDTYFPDGQVLHHDLAGRLLRMARPNVQWRRGLSGRTIELRRRTRDQGGGLERRLLSEAEADRMVDESAARMRLVAGRMERGEPVSPPAGRGASGSAAALHALVETAARFDAGLARNDVARFRAIYQDVPILPPDQYSALVLVATDGCPYNRCTFCGFYRQMIRHTKTPDEFRAHVDSALAYHGRGLALRRGVFLGQANALLGPRPWREEILRIVAHRCEFPPVDLQRAAPDWWQGSLSRFTGISSFLDAAIGVRIGAEEFSALRQLHLRQVFIGLESGADGLLKWLRKPATAQQMVDTVRSARAGGVQVGVIVLIGAGGERFFDEHVDQTVQVIGAMGLGPGDYVYLSPLVIAHGAEYADLAEAEGIRPLTPARLVEQEQSIRRGIRAAAGQSGPYVAHYEVENFVY